GQLGFQRNVLRFQIEKWYLHRSLALLWFLRHRLDHAQHARRVARDDGSGRDVSGHDRAGSHDRRFADRDTSEQHGSGTYRCTSLHQRRHDVPVLVRLDPTALCRGPGVQVVDKADVVTYEHFILDRHALADEAVALDLA